MLTHFVYICFYDDSIYYEIHFSTLTRRLDSKKIFGWKKLFNLKLIADACFKCRHYILIF